MNFRLMIFLSLFSCNAVSEELPSIDEYLIQFNIKYFCNNPKYINCMKITKNKCIQSFENAVSLCMSQKVSDASMPSSVCITNNYVQYLNVDEKTLQSCEYIADDMAAKYKDRHMPNN